jgi:hypothetical protein
MKSSFEAYVRQDHDPGAVFDPKRTGQLPLQVPVSVEVDKGEDMSKRQRSIQGYLATHPEVASLPNRKIMTLARHEPQRF